MNELMNIYRMDEERGWAEYERMNELMNIYRMDECGLRKD